MASGVPYSRNHVQISLIWILMNYGHYALASRVDSIEKFFAPRNSFHFRNFEYEVQYLPGRRMESIYLENSSSKYSGFETMTLTAFNRSYELRLKRNLHLTNMVTKVIARHTNGSHFQTGDVTDCHMLHVSHQMTAAVSQCSQGETRGVIITDENMLQIEPFQAEMRPKRRISHKMAHTPHLIRRMKLQHLHKLLPRNMQNKNRDAVPLEHDRTGKNDKKTKRLYNNRHEKAEQERNVKQKKAVRKTLELAVFVDQNIQQMFLPYFHGDENKFLSFLLAFVNQIQAIYYLPSLGQKLDITINRLQLMTTNLDKNSQDGSSSSERSQVLKNFCFLNANLNSEMPTGAQWDMGLYLTSSDLFAVDKGERSTTTMGLAVIGGVCHQLYSCVIGELGATGDNGAPYPSSGFTAAYVAAHEIGHNLGLLHDSQLNQCRKDGFIMSPSRGLKSETVWSECSRRQLKNSNATCLNDLPSKEPEIPSEVGLSSLPGQIYDVDQQCQLFVKDPEARAIFNPKKSVSVCRTVRCESSRFVGHFYAGPALEGTFCDTGKWCRSGKCVSWTENEKPHIQNGGWSTWNVTSCTSGCTFNSKGVKYLTRKCSNPRKVNTFEGCAGPHRVVELCDDYADCDKPTTVEEKASRMCRHLSSLVQIIDPKGVGLQVPHNNAKPWQACSVYCRTTDDRWFSPRTRLQFGGTPWYLPDGTLCHRDGSYHFYCQNHVCTIETSMSNELMDFNNRILHESSHPEDEQLLWQQEKAWEPDHPSPLLHNGEDMDILTIEQLREIMKNKTI